MRQFIMASKDQAITVTKTNNNTAISTAENNTKKAKNNDRAGASSQHQLLQLAKSYAIDGALLPEDKQMPIADRALKKFNHDQIRKQKNLETILKKAIAYCNDENIVDKANPDWFTRFLSLAENVSNATMQGLWAKILAGEIAQPGSFSFKSLLAFQDMSIYDAKLFAKLCGAACHDKKKQNYFVLFGASQKPTLLNIFSRKRQQMINLSNHGLPYSDLLSLADNHLMFTQETEMFFTNKAKPFELVCNGVEIIFHARKNNAILSYYKFTPTGVELARLISDVQNKDYLSDVKTTLGQHFNISTES